MSDEGKTIHGSSFIVSGFSIHLLKPPPVNQSRTNDPEAQRIEARQVRMLQMEHPARSLGVPSPFPGPVARHDSAQLLGEIEAVKGRVQAHVAGPRVTAASSAAESSRAAAAAESRIDSGRVAPTTGTTPGPCASAQATTTR